MTVSPTNERNIADFDMSIEHGEMAIDPTKNSTYDGVYDRWTFTRLAGSNALGGDYEFVGPCAEQAFSIYGGTGLTYSTDHTDASGAAIIARLQCVAEGTASLHLVPQAENAGIYTATFGGGGALLPSSVGPDVIVTCSVGGPSSLVDADFDGCSDEEEEGETLALGGSRIFHNSWDFADVPTPALPGGARNGAVALTDVGAALTWVGATNGGGLNVNGRDYDDDDNANGVEDGAEYDRTPNDQISGPPNGAVSLADVGVILAQVGDSCVAAPN
jgi:hypothetical protein